MDKELIKEAEYCLNCKIKPCSEKGCPLGNNIPEFIKRIKEERYEDAFKVLEETTVLPSICGRICPHNKQCMGSCVRGIKTTPVKIGKLEAFIGDMSIEKGYKIDKQNSTINKLNIAIIGGGPAGISAAAFLKRKGYRVTIYEKYNYLGGLLMHGIPEFRLSKEIVKNTINKVLELGIEVKYNKELGKNLQLEELKKKYDKIVLAYGANKSTKIGIPGEDLEGVYGGNELLEQNNHPDYKGKTVIVNGGGNVAMDISRTIRKLGARRVIVVYRREREHMPAEQKEIEEAINEGVEFLFKNNVIKILGTKKVERVELIKTDLVEKEGETRLFPINIENSNYLIDADYVVMAIGSEASDFTKELGLELNKNGTIKVNEKFQTSDPRIYAIGDLAGNIKTVAWAARSGRDLVKFI